MEEFPEVDKCIDDMDETPVTNSAHLPYVTPKKCNYQIFKSPQGMMTPTHDFLALPSLLSRRRPRRGTTLEK